MFEERGEKNVSRKAQMDSAAGCVAAAGCNSFDKVGKFAFFWFLGRRFFNAAAAHMSISV